MRALAGAFRRSANRLRILAVLLLAAFFAGRSSMEQTQAQPPGNSISLACVSRGITGAELSEIRRSEERKVRQVMITAWSEKAAGIVSRPDGTRSIASRVLEINGSSELLLPYGRILQQGDSVGCLLGKETAEKLFGSRDVDGLSLRYGERELTVRGVFDAPGEMVVVAADSDSECFGRIAMRSAQQLPEGLAAGRFIAEYGLDARQVRYDIFGADYLQGMIPGKWSDFDGWKKSFGRMREDIGFLLRVEKGGVELWYMECRGRAAACALAAVLLLLTQEFCLRRIRGNDIMVLPGARSAKEG